MTTSSDPMRRSGAPEFKMPTFFMPFPMEVNPAPSPEDETMQWAENFGLIPGDTAKRRFRDAEFGRLVRYSFPMADKGSLELMSAWMAWFFWFDDQFDDGPLGFRPDLLPDLLTPFLDVLDGTSKKTDSPLVLALADLTARSYAIGPRSPAWSKRFVRDARDYVNSYRREALCRANKRYFGVGEYLSHRKESSALRMIFSLFEIVVQADLPDRVVGCAAYRTLRDTVGQVTGIHNDILGLEKEMARDYPHNLVLVLREAQKCSLQEAVDLANATVTGILANFLMAQFELPRQLDALDVDAKTKAAAIRTAYVAQTMIRGHIDWSLSTKRLQNVEYTEQGQQPTFLPELLVPHAVAAGGGGLNHRTASIP